MNQYIKIYRVVTRNNLVIRLEQVSNGKPAPDNLAAGTRLALAYKNNGCIDGDYDFTNIHTAKDFAVLSLDFVKKLASRNLESLESHNFSSKPKWANP